MAKTKILVLSGGDSPEREIALMSGDAVYQALKANDDAEVRLYDPLDGDEGLVQAIQWADIVLPILHGVNGEDGEMQRKIESLKTMFLGSGSETSELSFDKHRTHELLEKHDVQMPRHAMVTADDLGHELFRTPYVLKPNANGSSIDTLIVREPTDENSQRVKELLAKYDEMILEELIEGLEITVPVLGSEALPVIAIVPPRDEEFDYENKYNGKTLEICPVPTDLLPASVQTKAQLLALRIHKLLNCEHLSRTDMIVTEDGEPVVLELNTMPGMNSQSLFPKAAAAAGYDMPKLTSTFVELVKKDMNT